jgi:hypothetical protein
VVFVVKSFHSMKPTTARPPMKVAKKRRITAVWGSAGSCSTEKCGAR